MRCARWIIGLSMVAVPLLFGSCGGGGEPVVPITPPADGIMGQVTVYGTSTPISGVTVRLIPSGPSVTTDAAGDYTIRGLTAGAYTQVEFSRSAYQTRYVDFPGLAQTLNVGLVHIGAGSISGQIVDAEGEPVDGARVEVLGLPQATTTNSSGHYSLYDAPGGLQTLRSGALGFRTQTADVTVHDGASIALNMQLDRSTALSSLSGTVKDAITHAAIPGATLWLNESKRAMSDQDGAYAFYELKPGSVAMTVSAPGYRSATLANPLPIELGQNVYNILLLPSSYVEPPPPA
jgi:hypothetical protein